MQSEKKITPHREPTNCQIRRPLSSPKTYHEFPEIQSNRRANKPEHNRNDKFGLISYAAPRRYRLTRTHISARKTNVSRDLSAIVNRRKGGRSEFCISEFRNSDAVWWHVVWHERFECFRCARGCVYELDFCWWFDFISIVYSSICVVESFCLLRNVEGCSYWESFCDIYLLFTFIEIKLIIYMVKKCLFKRKKIFEHDYSSFQLEYCTKFNENISTIRKNWTGFKERKKKTIWKTQTKYFSENTRNH